jgi:HSP20 family molecular chaperone IbpA
MFRNNRTHLLTGQTDLRSLSNVANSLLDDIFNHALQPFAPIKAEMLEKQHPRMNAYDKGGYLIVDLFVPYYTKDDIAVEADTTKQTVTITGNSNQDNEVADKDYYLRQISRGSFKRSLQVSDPDYDVDQLKAELNEGILRLTIPPKKGVDSPKTKKVKIL